MENSGRAENADVALQAFLDLGGTDEEDGPGDLLCNFGHLLRARGFDPLHMFARAISNFVAEERDPSDGMGPTVKVCIDVSEDNDRPSYAELALGLADAINVMGTVNLKHFRNIGNENIFRATLQRLAAMAAHAEPVKWLKENGGIKPISNKERGL